MNIITDEQQLPLAVEFKTGAGNPAVVDGIPVWRSSDPTIVAVNPSQDGLTAKAVSVGPLGSAQVTCEGDADLGSGTRPVIGVIEIEVKAAEAVQAIVTAGEPEPKGT